MRPAAFALLAFVAFFALGPVGALTRAEGLIQTRRWEADIRSLQVQGGYTEPLSLLLAVGERVFVMDGPEAGWRLRETFRAPREWGGAMALGDVTRDRQSNLAWGGDGPGAVYVYRRGSTGWVLTGRTDYLWNPVAGVSIADVTGDGRRELLVVGSDGKAHLFEWAFGEFQLLWQSPQDGYRFIAPADLTGDGQPEIVLSRSEGYVGVYGWQQGGLVPLWENYPWGAMSGMTLGDVDGDGLPDIVLNTSRGLLYVFGWAGDEFRMKRHLAHPDLPFPYLAVSRPQRSSTSPGVTYLLASRGEGLQAFRLTDDRLLPIWSARQPLSLQALHAVPGTGAFLVWDKDALRLLESSSSQHWHLVWEGEERKWLIPPITNDEGHFLVSARDVGELLDWHVHWNQQQQRLAAAGRTGFFVATPGAAHVVTHQGERTLDAPVMLLDGRIYLPYDLLSALGFFVEWDELGRTLTVDAP